MNFNMVKVYCPRCNAKINVPFFKDLKKRALSDYLANEEDAQKKLFNLELWIARATLWTFLVYWWKYKLFGNY